MQFYHDPVTTLNESASIQHAGQAQAQNDGTYLPKTPMAIKAAKRKRDLVLVGEEKPCRCVCCG